VYRYFFTEVPDAPASSIFGAVHGLELLYLFGVLDIQGNVPTAAERSLSATMQAYWAGLATNGTPTATGAPAWTPYDAGRDNHLVLDATALAMDEGVNTARCDFWSGFGV
jgi:para-nitrobenzyl esterase